MVTVGQLCAALSSELHPVGDIPAPNQRLSGVHISELDDPTSYLSGAELLLTTGIPLHGTDRSTREYVERLARRNVAALGVGLGEGLDVLPEALREACATAGLALLVIPKNVAFLTISRAYWDLSTQAGKANLRASLGTQTALARAATLPDALPLVVKALAQALGGWVAYLPVEGAETLWPATAGGVLPELRNATTRIFTGTGVHAAATFQVNGINVVQYPVVLDRAVTGYLAIGAGRTLTADDRQVILTVCVLLSLKAQQQREQARRSAALDGAVATLLIRGHTEAARALAADLRIPLPTGPVRVLVVEGLPAGASAAEEASAIAGLTGVTQSDQVAEAARRCRLRVIHSARRTLIIDAPLAAVRTFARVAQPATPPSGDHVRGVLSRPVMLHRVLDAVTHGAAELVDIPFGVLALPSHEGADAQTEEWIRVLRAAPRADLVPTVVAYLKHRGQWEAAARELGIHRNSLRLRIAAAEDHLGLSLEDPTVSAKLWLALRAQPD